MSPGRSHKPLFEVLSEHPPKGALTGRQRRDPAPGADAATPTSTPTPPEAQAPSQAPPARQPEAERGADRATRQAEPKPVRRVIPAPMPVSEDAVAQHEARPASRPVVTIPLSTVYTAISLAVVLVLLAWIGGYQIGYAGAKSDLITGSQQDRPNVVSEPDPGLTPPFQLPNQTQGETSLSGSLAANNPRQPESQPAQQTATVTPPATAGQGSPSGTILSPRGLLETDPRQPGLNYLELGTFSREMTQDAIDFMSAGGQEAIGIPQSGGRYRLISVGLAIPGARWSAMSDQRSAHQRDIADIGARWVSERQGGSDFTQTQWTKYQP
ncbi:MAG: hypothetical protein ACF8Q5_01385 [Phycisphaerales bacterium JB040]